MASYLGLDIGTSSVKGVLVDEAQVERAEASAPLSLSRPVPLWSEQDPAHWWAAVGLVAAALRDAAPQAWAGLAGIGLSGQMHGAVLLDRAGEVLRPAILWNDGRSGLQCAELTRRLPDIAARASNLPMPGFTSPKLLWVAEHEPDIFARTSLVLLPKDYVRLRLTGEAVSDMSDASGTLWLDIARRRWDEALLKAGGMRLDQMPALVEGSAVSGMLKPELAAALGLAGRRIPVAGGGGDNAASAVGIGAVEPGQGFLSLGTSGVLFSVTDHAGARPERTLHTMCHALPGRWHAMAVNLSAAAALQWAADLLGRDVAALVREAEAFAADPARRAAAPLFLPYLSGERTPHNDPEASGLLAALKPGHDAGAVGYAVMEGVAFAFADDLDVMEEAGARPRSVMLVGGGARSAFWGQLLADTLGLPLDLPDNAERGAAFGAARLAMLAADAGSIEEICSAPALRARVEPRRAVADLLRPRLSHWRALYRAERTLRDTMPEPAGRGA
jgi:xylulokinase